MALSWRTRCPAPFLYVRRRAVCRALPALYLVYGLQGLGVMARRHLSHELCGWGPSVQRQAWIDTYLAGSVCLTQLFLSVFDPHGQQQHTRLARVFLYRLRFQACCPLACAPFSPPFPPRFIGCCARKVARYTSATFPTRQLLGRRCQVLPLKTSRLSFCHLNSSRFEQGSWAFIDAAAALHIAVC